MPKGIGTTLREARGRRKVDLAAAEETTKIRLRFLQAMENEEWDALPGGVYTRSFIRTYASYLGLDGERLAAEYDHDRPADSQHPPGPPPALGVSRRWRGISASGRAVIVSLVLIVILVAIGLLGRDRGSPGDAPQQSRAEDRAPRTHAQPPAPRPRQVTVRLRATAEVWVCLLDDGEKALVNGQILAPGAEEGPFRATGFVAAFGNGEVALTVNGGEVPIPASASPVGYEIGLDGELTPLAEGERPTCT